MGRHPILLFILVLLPGAATPPVDAQTGLPDTLRAMPLSSVIHVDGRLDEPAWGKAPHIRDFTQRELNEGEPVTERTEVAVLYDEAALFIGVWCYDSEPEGLVAQKMKRDFEFDSEDNFRVIIDTYHDRRNGYLFVTNPNGALADGLVINNGSQVNEDWDGVWVVAARTTGEGAVPATNYLVARWKRDVLRQSTAGVIATGKSEPHRTNATAGFDLLYSTDRLFGDKNLSLGAALARSFTSDAAHRIGAAHRVFIDYPNDIVDFSAVWDRSGGHFNPEMGFLRRTGYQMYNADLRIKPRPDALPWIRNLAFKPFDFNYYVDDRTGRLQSLWTEFRPLGFTTRSGEFFEFNIQRSAEHLTGDFEIHHGVVLAPGTYWFTHYELQFATFRGRSLAGEFFINRGNFYDGTRTETAGRITWRVNRYLSLSGDYQQNDIMLPAGGFTVREEGGRADFAFNPGLFGSVFGQWNDDDEEVLLNFRINWIPRPETDLFFVVNQSIDTADRHWTVSNTTVLTKFVWRFVL